MYTQIELSKMVFFDLETASEFSSLSELSFHKPLMADLWKKRCEYLRSRFEENKEKSDEWLYENKAALTPEFSRIICASFGRLHFENDPTLGDFTKFTVKSYASENEKEVLEGIETVFNKFSNYRFCGHNIKRFDVPMMCKRLYINGKILPKGLQITNLKPWEMPLIDTSEIWSFGAWQEGFASLELVAESLNIKTPKDDIHGDEVGHVFWNEKNISRISQYCQKDVLTVSQIILKLSNQKLVEEI